MYVCVILYRFIVQNYSIKFIEYNIYKTEYSLFLMLIIALIKGSLG